MLSAGAVGLLAHDELVIYAIEVLFGGKSNSDGIGHFEAYGAWNRFLFLVTFISSCIGFFFALLGHFWTKEAVKDVVQEDKSLKMVQY